MFQLHFYRRFFDLDTETFFRKIQQALNPFNGAQAVDDDLYASDSELYGFIWITGTLIFLVFVSSTGSNLLAEWLHPTKKSQKYEYSFDLLTLSISLFYGYNVVVPALFWGFTTWFLKFPQPTSLIRVISIYGYTNILWVPITVLNLLIVLIVNNKKHHLLLNLLEWLVVLFSGLVTGLSNITKLRPIVQKNCLLLHEGDADASTKQAWAIIAGLAVAHAGFVLLVKISFFGITA